MMGIVSAGSPGGRGGRARADPPLVTPWGRRPWRGVTPRQPFPPPTDGCDTKASKKKLQRSVTPRNATPLHATQPQAKYHQNRPRIIAALVGHRNYRPTDAGDPLEGPPANPGQTQHLKNSLFFQPETTNPKVFGISEKKRWG